MGKKDTRVDDYIRDANEFARPILSHLRDLIHQACPDIEEAIKWRMPFYVYKGPLFGTPAFSKHCALAFWKDVHVIPEAKGKSDGMGDLGRITSLKDLPKDSVLLGYFQKAWALRDAPKSEKRPVRSVRPGLPVPPELKAALSKNKKAAAEFETFTPSHRREYIEWIQDAKRPETKARRIETALQWIAEGKSQNWRYEK